MRWRSRRVGIDLDGVSRLTLLKVFFNAKYLFPDSRIEVKRTAKGFHIRIFKQHSLTKNIHVRLMLCDDPMRITIDENKIRWRLTNLVDTLFTFKKEKGKITREEECNVLAQPFYSRLPCRKTKIVV